MASFPPASILENGKEAKVDTNESEVSLHTWLGEELLGFFDTLGTVWIKSLNDWLD